MQSNKGEQPPGGEQRPASGPAEASLPSPALRAASPSSLRGRGTSTAGVGEVTEPRPALPREIGGRDGPEPTRFGDWEKAGRCIDF